MTRTEQDLALVREIIGVDPLDFARRAGGELVIILPDGRKLVLTEEQVSQALQSGQYCIHSVEKKDESKADPAEADPLPAPAKRGRGRPAKDPSSLSSPS